MGLLEKFIIDNEGIKTEEDYIERVQPVLYDLAGKNMDDVLAILKSLMLNGEKNKGYGYAGKIFYYILTDEKFVDESAYKMLLIMFDESVPSNSRVWAMKIIKLRYDYLKDFEGMYEDVKYAYMWWWLGDAILDKQVEKSGTKNMDLVRHARNDEVYEFGYGLYAYNDGDALKDFELVNVLRKSQCISDHMKLRLDQFMQRLGEPKYRHERIEPEKINYTKEQKKLKKEITQMLIKYDEQYRTEREEWDLEDVFIKLIIDNASECLPVLRDCIFDLVGNDDDECRFSVFCILRIFSVDEYEKDDVDLIGKTALEIFDKHPNHDVRYYSLVSIDDFYHLRSELEKRYETEKDSFIKYCIGNDILNAHAKEAGLENYHDLTRMARAGEARNFEIRLVEYDVEIQKQILKFLKCDKLVSDHMREYVRICLEKIE